MDKTNYQKRRKDKLRGQGDYPKAKFYPKGETVSYTTREGEEADYPNARGEYGVFKKGGLRFYNRAEKRQMNKISHPATKKNYAHQGRELGFKHKVNPAGTKQAKRENNNG